MLNNKEEFCLDVVALLVFCGACHKIEGGQFGIVLGIWGKNEQNDSRHIVLDVSILTRYCLDIVSGLSR